jgi:hypothetical protein
MNRARKVSAVVDNNINAFGWRVGPFRLRLLLLTKFTPDKNIGGKLLRWHARAFMFHFYVRIFSLSDVSTCDAS